MHLGVKKALLYQISVLTIHGKTKIAQTTINLKSQLQHRIVNLNYLMDHILYQICKIFLSIF